MSKEIFAINFNNMRFCNYKAWVRSVAMFAISIALYCLTLGQDVLAAPKARIAKAKAPINQAQSYLGSSVWRASECGQYHGFQTFRFGAAPKVEVGNGRIGDGEALDMFYSNRRGNIIEIKTKVCAPVGCNQTLEEYKILNQNQIQEWRFEGHLPNEAPNVVVKDGIASDGSAGRVFNRCRS